MEYISNIFVFIYGMNVKIKIFRVINKIGYLSRKKGYNSYIYCYKVFSYLDVFIFVIGKLSY